MNMKPPNVSRRSFLKSAGISIGLPSLESLGQVTASKPPMRMVCIASALGMNPEAFFPKSFDHGFELSPVLSPLAGLREDFTVLSHMDHPAIFTKHGSMSSFLSGIDQIVVDELVRLKTQLPS